MTPGSSPPKKWQRELAWRAALLAAVATVVAVLGQLAEVWWFPQRAADYAVRQLESSDAAANSLRLFDSLHALLPTLTGVIILALGVVLLAPVVRAWISDRKHRGQVTFRTKGQANESR